MLLILEYFLLDLFFVVDSLYTFREHYYIVNYTIINKQKELLDMCYFYGQLKYN